MDAELLTIKIKYMIAQKNWITAMAERDNLSGGWACNYQNDQINLDLEIEAMIKQLEQENK